ncbi:MAG: hypothetical protein OEN50_17955 [Deltaproteobacteria bacterium]|nr:hypothetical protein [Deltaproteobacteria bacterium]
MGRVIVEFPECREVFVGGQSQGNNRDEQGEYLILLIGDGLQTFTLGGDKNFTPLSQPVNVGSGSVIRPQRVVFQRKA